MKTRITPIIIALLLADRAYCQNDTRTEPILEVIAAFSNLVTKMETRDINGIQSMITGTNVAISTAIREQIDYGTDINLNFATNGFYKDIQSIRLTHPSVAQVRTVSTCVWFQRDNDGEWKITQYLDKPIE